MHVHCTTKCLEPTFKEVKGNRDNFVLFMLVLSPLASDFLKFTKHVHVLDIACIIMYVSTGTLWPIYTSFVLHYVNDKRKIRCKFKVVN